MYLRGKGKKQQSERTGWCVYKCGFRLRITVNGEKFIIKFRFVRQSKKLGVFLHSLYGNKVVYHP